jgi:serine/threonine-protein kinase
MATSPGVASAGAAGAAVAVGRVSSDSIPVGGFTPGMILADRYRIIGLLGRGGMGEVYRADDLKLGQPVALKFLPRELASDPVRREHLFSEVRITRQLSHPNICRVYDIAEFEGRHFLSMEFIDGEDLASLIKRIGYLSNEKALEITRQLVAGVAAAHERGVLHRDLKPANIMIDGHGRVRITDFGLAVAINDETQSAEVSGTPAYMAPEQLAGKGATVRSDIYALGLVLYELYCGKRAFTAASIAELREQKEGHMPTAFSDIRPGFDPIVERLIMRCLERDPRVRRASAAQLAAALPGGDPLAAAIAAGETPSPEMVAAAGLKEGLRPGIALLLLAATVLGLFAAAVMNRRTTVLELVPPGKSPEFLAERAREILSKGGYAVQSADNDFGLYYNNDFLTYTEKNNTADVRDQLGDFSPILFDYRRSLRPIQRTNFISNSVDENEPPLAFSGDVDIKLDLEGRLLYLEAIPPELESHAGPPLPPDWGLLFSQAGLDISKWTPVQPDRVPSYYADSRAAWTGALPFGHMVPVRIEAAAFHGKPISFEIIGPWTESRRTASTVVGRSLPRQIGIAIVLSVAFIVVASALFFALRNLRLGRGDRRGARRIAVVSLALFTVSWLLEEHHVATPWELILFLMFATKALGQAAVLWVFYIALEPLVRRRRPQTLVSWSRLLNGEWRDSLAGRDLLIGCVGGALFLCLVHIRSLMQLRFGYSPGLIRPSLDALLGTSSFVAAISDQVSAGLVLSFGMLFLFLLLKVLLRNEYAAALAFIALAFLPGNATFGWVSAAYGVIFGLLVTFLLLRFGFVALVGFFLVPPSFPITLQSSAWYFSIGFVSMLVPVVLALYAFRISLGGNKLLNLAGLED